MREPKRRSFLRNGIASVAGLSGISRIGYAEDTVEIVVEWRGSKPFVTKRVPRSWYEYEQHRRIVLERVQDRYGSEPGVRDVFSVPTEKRVGGKRIHDLKIEVEEEAEVDIPKSVDGVDVRTGPPVETTRAGHDPYCYNDDDFTDMWGGIMVRGDVTGTSGCKVEKNGSEYLVTANHLFLAGDDCEENTGDELNQHGELFGEVWEYDSSMDWATVKETGDLPLQEYVLGSTDGFLDPVSHVGKDGLMDMSSNGTPVHKQGISTGQTSGKVKALDKNYSDSCIDLADDAVVTSNDTVKGDSGGPLWKTSADCSDCISIVSITVVGRSPTLSTGCNGYTLYNKATTTPAYKMHNNAGLKFV